MSKRAQLVCQHLKNISRAALEKHQGIVRASKEFSCLVRPHGKFQKTSISLH